MRISASEQYILKQFFAQRPIHRAYLFGSYARDEADEASDIDILVELDYAQHIGMKFFLYQEELRNLLHKKVDIVTADGLSRHLKPQVDQDKILIYERPAD